MALGSNLGNRRAHLRHAVSRLGDAAGMLMAVSSLYETDPIGGPDQGPYLNAVVVLDTPLPPRTLLDLCLEIERERGRVRGGAAAPRTLDLDVLIHGAAVIREPGFVVPHPRMTERRFVLEPLVEVWGEGPVPGIADLRAALATTTGQGVRRVDGPRWARRPSGSTVAAAAAAAAGLGVVASRLLRRRRG